MAYLLCVYELRSSWKKEKNCEPKKELPKVYTTTMMMRDYKMHTVNANHYWVEQLTHEGNS